MPSLIEYKERIAGHFSDTESAPWNWVFYGDSITHGAAHTHGWRSFPEIFAERVRWEMKREQDVIINTAFSGRTACTLADKEYFDLHVTRFAPNAVFLLVGTNDIVKTPGGVEAFQEYLDTIAEKIVALGAVPVIQNYPPILKAPENADYMARYEKMPLYNKAIEETAQKYNAIFVDHWSHWISRTSHPRFLAHWQGETIHPGARGHFEMAVTIFKTLGIYSEDSLCSHIFN